MKIRNLLNLALVLIVGQLMFACNSAKYYEFAAHKPEAYNKAKEKPAPAQEAEAAPTLTELALAAAEAEAAKEEAAPVLEASTEKKVMKAPRKAAVAEAPLVKEEVQLVEREMSVAEAEALAMAKERLANMTKAEKKELKKELKEAIKQDRGTSRTSVVEIILAILLPPLAVFLHDGIGTSFWINIILTLLFVIPGIIHALLVVTDTI